MYYDTQRWDLKTAPPADWQVLLLDAADLIERLGLCKGDWQSSDGFCTMGAILETTARRGLTSDTEREAVRRLCAHIKRGNVFFWNDDRRRTKEEVVIALRRAAHA
jgi:hypothetical protein